MIGTTTNGIPSRTIAAAFRTGSGSDRIISHLSFSIFHLLIVGHGTMTNESFKWEMVNDKWKMIRSLPLAVLTLSVKNKRGPTGVLSSPSLVLMKLIRTSLQDRKNQRPSHF